MSAISEALKPYLWLAAIAFVVGFMSYLAMGRPAVAAVDEPIRSIISVPAEATSAPASDEWNIPKKI